MSYYVTPRSALGADAPACPAGFVYAEGQCALAPAPGVPEEMVGRPPGDYFWQAGNPGSWRRAKLGEAGVLPNGIKVRVQVQPGVKQTYAEQQGQLVSTGVSLDPTMQSCVAAGVPEQFLPTCYESITKGGKIHNFAVAWKECAGTGMPPELIPTCVQARQSGQSLSLAEVVKQIQDAVASGELAPPPPGAEEVVGGSFPSRTLLIVGGLAGLGLLVYFLRRKK